ncbi:hypothetical protein FQA39_LY14821 [Lamprigera yunnana]|nr:hypothetical protein FQA39_LY14821 [Lamprigera yunnana]
MDELKHKILGLLSKQSPKIPSMGFSDADYQFFQNENLSINSKTVTELNRPADQDILESIEKAYFSTNEDFDVCRFELSKLPEFLDCTNIQRDFKKLKQQHQVVANKVLQLILDQTSNCEEEFLRTLEVRDKLADVLILCRISRKELNVAEKQFSSSLSILANYRKRKLVQNLLNNLNTIKTLHRTGHRLQELLNEENYAGAIELLQECQAAANTYRHFTCVASLTNKLQETLEDTEEKLDKVLAQMCFYFDSVRYSKLQAAYKLLGKTQIAMDHLHMHYTSATYNTALNIVRVYVTSTDFMDINDNSEKKPYDKLCLYIDQSIFIPCLVDLCKSLFKIVLSYYQLRKWHLTFESPGAADDLEDNFNKQYIKQKLENGLLKVWHDVQSKISTLLLNSNLSLYKFDQFVQILSVVHRLMEVGEEFCCSKSDDLQESIRKQSINYFKNYHAQRLDELRIFLENESWEICPVKTTFDILQLQEFKSLRSILRNYKGKTQVSQPYANSLDCNSSNHSQDGSSIIGNYFLRYAEHGTPFDKSLDETVIDEDILATIGDKTSGYFSDETDDESEELKQDFVDDNVDDMQRSSIEKKEKHSCKAPILTNTSLSVLRQIGKYLQMCRLLRPIAFDIILCMAQLFDFYVYVVHFFFSADLTVSSGTLYTLKLNATLKRITDNLIWDNQDESTQYGKITKPHLSTIVDMTKPELLHGLSERVAAVESLIFLSKQYLFLQGYLEYLLPPNNKIILQQFFSQSIACAPDLRKPIYMCVAARAFDLRQNLISMSKINWEVKDVMSQHNAYIDVMLREVQIFAIRLEELSSKIPISNEVSKMLWENIAHIITHTLVQGFSDAKKCTNGGRALMQLDFTQFLLKFEKISLLKGVPHREYVENYVKAYYLPDVELEKWLREHNISIKCIYDDLYSAYISEQKFLWNKFVNQKLITVVQHSEVVEVFLKEYVESEVRSYYNPSIKSWADIVQDARKILMDDGIRIVHSGNSFTRWLLENPNYDLKQLRFLGQYKFLFNLYDRILTKHNPLLTAVINLNVAEAEALIKVKPELVEQDDACGRSVLHLVALHGFNHKPYVCYKTVDEKLLDIVKVISKEKIQMKPDAVLCYSPLNYVVANWSVAREVLYIRSTTKDVVMSNYFYSHNIMSTDHKNMCESPLNDLFKFKSKGNAVVPEYYYDLRFASAFGIEDNVKYLLNKECDVNQQDVYRNTCLHYACIIGMLKNVQVLLDTGARVNILNRNSNTALHYAIRRNCPEITELLLKNCANVNSVDPNIKNNKQITALHYAAQMDFTDIMELFIKKCGNLIIVNYRSETPLFYAIKSNHTNAVLFLIKRGADMNMCNKEGESVLHKVCEKGFNSAKALIKHGAEVNSVDMDKETSLNCALINSHADTAKILLEYRVDINIPNYDGVVLYTDTYTPDDLKNRLKFVSTCNIPEEVFKKLLENTFASLIRRSEIHDMNTLYLSKADVIKEIYATLLTVGAELARHNMSADEVKAFLAEHNFNAVKIDSFVELYNANKRDLQIVLGNIGSHPPHIVDADWKIDYIVKASNLDQSEGPIFRISLVTNKYDESSDTKKTENVNFSFGHTVCYSLLALNLQPNVTSWILQIINMGDVLDINDAVDLDVEDEGDQGVLRLKDKVLRRKGRGFGAGERRDQDKIRGYDSVDPGDFADESGPQKSVEGWILFITSVHEEASEEDLSEKFSEFGAIKNLAINLDRRTGFLKGYALIEYGVFEEANAAREALDGSEILGQTIGVDWCFVKGPKKNKRNRNKRR